MVSKPAKAIANKRVLSFSSICYILSAISPNKYIKRSNIIVILVATDIISITLFCLGVIGFFMLQNSNNHLKFTLKFGLKNA
jgi:NADH:ubiquinone oxidoreductase subunit K